MKLNKTKIISAIIGVLIIIIGIFSIIQINNHNAAKPKSYESMSVFSKKYNQPPTAKKTPIVELYIKKSKDSQQLVNTMAKYDSKRNDVIFQIYDLSKHPHIEKTMNIKTTYVRSSKNNEVLFEKSNPSNKDIKTAINKAISEIG